MAILFGIALDSTDKNNIPKDNHIQKTIRKSGKATKKKDTGKLSVKKKDRVLKSKHDNKLSEKKNVKTTKKSIKKVVKKTVKTVLILNH